MIQGRQSWVFLNFQIKIPTAARPKIAPIIFGTIPIYLSILSYLVPDQNHRDNERFVTYL
jgi:hypothetical protein